MIHCTAGATALSRTSKSFCLAVAALALLAAGTPASAGSDKLPDKGRIVYKMTGPGSGTTTVIWANGGRKFRTETHTTIAFQGKSMSMETTAFSDGKYLYTYSSKQGKTAMRMPLPKGASPKDQLAGLKEDSKLVGKGTVLGKPCEVRVKGGAKAWLWNGLLLKMEIQAPQPQGRKGGSSMTMVATSVDISPRLDDSLFRLPAGYTVTDMKMPAGMPGAGVGAHPGSMPPAGR